MLISYHGVSSADLTPFIAIPYIDTSRSGAEVVWISNVGEATDGTSIEFFVDAGGVCVLADHSIFPSIVRT